jgi:hypothetical protein
MAIDKALYAAPQGIAALNNDEPDLEITIEDPEAVEIGIDGEPIMRIEKGENEEGFGDNLAEYIDDGTLSQLASDLLSDFEDDVASRKDWMQTYVDGLELLGMKIEERSEPWEGACGIYHPLLSEALVKFQAEMIMETMPPRGPAKMEIIGKETPEKMDAAQRVEDDMNYQIMDVMVEYRAEHERMLWGLGLSGNAFKKVYEDPHLGRQVSMFCPAEDVVVPYGVSSLESSPRVTHVMRKTENEIKRLQYSGFYLDVDLGNPSNSLDEVEKRIAEQMGFRATTDDRYKILEMHVDLDLEGFEDEEDGEETGLALPYVVTIEKATKTVLSIRRNWKEDDDNRLKRNHFVHYPYIPGFGFYAFGLIHLIGAFAKSGTSLIRQLVDAGTLSNLPGGFKTRGLRVKGDDTPIAPGEFRDVDVPSGAMKDNIMPLPYKEPSQVLMALLGQIVEDGRRFANTADLQVADMGSAGAPVGTTLAILERTLKVMTAVQARIHYSMKQELRLLKDIIEENCPEDYSYEPEVGSRKAKKSDYALVTVIPVSDPNAATMSQKIVQYQAVLQLAQQAPQLYDMAQLHRQMLSVLGIKNAQKLVMLEEDKKPQDPVTENQNLMNGKPVKAFLYQDHEAHIQVHMAAAQDPKILSLLQQSPQAKAIEAAMSAHVTEHIAYAYRKKIEQMMGTELPLNKDNEDDQEEIPREMEVRISQMAAQAAQQLLQQHQGEAQQQKNQQMQQDPLIQLQQQELQLKGQEVEIKKTQQKIDAASKADQLAIERERIASQERIAGLNAGIKVEDSKRKLAANQQAEGLRIGVDIAKHKADLNHQGKQLVQTGAFQARQHAQKEQQMNNPKEQPEKGKDNK